MWTRGRIRFSNGGKEDVSWCLFVNSVFDRCKVLLHCQFTWGNEHPACVRAAGVELFLPQTKQAGTHTHTYTHTHTNTADLAKITVTGLPEGLLPAIALCILYSPL